MPQMGSLCWLCVGLTLWVCWLVFSIQVFFWFSLNFFVDSNNLADFFYCYEFFNLVDLSLYLSKSEFTLKMNY